jgi:hypothetical protein
MKTVNTFAKWLSEGRLDPVKAIERIYNLPNGKIFDDAKRIDGLFRASQHSWSSVVNAYEQYRELQEVAVIDIDDIEITQPNIQAGGVGKLLNTGRIPRINVVQFSNGEKVIYDGHHRLAANWALGNTRIVVNLVKLPR